MMRAVAWLAVWVSGVVYGQPAAVPQFEVASVKATRPEQLSSSGGGKSGHGRLTMSNVTLKRCIMGAYGVGPNQILGGPDWLDVDRYEIVAKAEQPVGDGELMVMLQTLLAERFHLAIHRETKAIRAFVLEVARNGPKLEKAEGSGESTTRNGRGVIDAKFTTMDRFAEVLSRQMELPVVNQTRLEGSFHVKLEWTPESDKAAESGLSIFTAIQQQLGLRLGSQNTPIGVVVIDHAERPSEN